VQEVAVVGMPDERWGEAPHAFVILAAGANATSEELRGFARDAMAHFKVPRDFHFVDELPKTATGKIKNSSCAAVERRSPHSKATPVRARP
jgi:fatty-acyl-CoA synthase